MISWIESKETAVIALIVFGIYYAVTAVIFVVAAILHKRERAAHLKATSPVMLTPLSVFAGLLIAFLASRVWSNLDRAQTDVVQEASALHEVVLILNSLPADISVTVRKSIKTYIDFIETRDWPTMAAGHANLRREPAGLPDAMAALLSFKPTAAGETLAQQRAVAALEQAFAARRSRILLSEAAIAPIQWIVIVLLTLLILITVAMVHVDRSITMFINLLTFATAAAICVVLLMVNDRPFAAGGNTVQPSALLELKG
jgi:hypothetical protein